MDTASFVNPLGGGFWMESFRGTTGADGQFAFTFQRPFNEIVAVNVERLPPTSTLIVTRLLGLNLTGGVAIAESRQKLTVLGIDLLSFATANAASQDVSVMVFGR